MGIRFALAATSLALSGPEPLDAQSSSGPSRVAAEVMVRLRIPPRLAVDEVEIAVEPAPDGARIDSSRVVLRARVRANVAWDLTAHLPPEWSRDPAFAICHPVGTPIPFEQAVVWLRRSDPPTDDARVRVGMRLPAGRSISDASRIVLVLAAAP